MSEENVVMFLRAVGEDEELSERVAEKPTVEGWLEIAANAGFEITPNELRSVAERLFDRELAGDECVTAFVERELDDDELSQVAGGMSQNPRRALSSNLMTRLGGISLGGDRGKITDSGPSWVDSGGMPGPGY